MPMHHALLTDYPWPDVEIERAVLAEYDTELIVAEQSDVQSLTRLATDADAIITNWTRIPAEVIRAATRCRIIARLGIGLDNVDIEQATRQGIVVTNVPDYCLIEVAEHTIATLLALARKLPQYHMLAQSGRYDLSAGFPLRRVEGRTLGLVGFGRIARCVARKANALGLRILATSRSQRDPVAGVSFVPLDSLLAKSDFVSLHLPLTAETERLVAREQFARMKPTAFLINTARGGLVDHSALADALAADRLAGAALDVQQPEPPDLGAPPYNDPRVLITPHAAFYSEQSVAELRTRVAHQVGRRLSGAVPEHVVNPQVLG